ncbi:urea ABC transporter permease subunit UrtB [Pseudomaricurvus alkylphenolicus]|nr:urea ABC transporter permease subunit UrtB [Pseudomaricurvus alkylphenolicus]
MEMWLASELYYDKASRQQIYRVSKNAEGKFDIARLLRADISLVPTQSIDKKLLKKVRTNNKLRKALREAIARTTLVNGSESERLQAVNAMLATINSDSAQLIEAALENEKSGEVRELMQVALALHLLIDGTPEQQLSALPQLQERLEPAVRSALNNALESAEADSRLSLALSNTLRKIEDRIEFYGLVEKLFFGLSLGSVFLLAAIGLAITFGVMGVINMAHGEMIMLGAYTTYVVQLLMPNHLEYSILVAIPAAFVVSGLVGVAIEQGVIRFLHGRPLETLLATFGISLILQQLVRTIFTPLNRQVASPEWMSGALELNPVLSLTYNRLYILAFSLLVFGILMYIFKKTNLGLNVRAVSQNRAMAKAMGVKTQWVDAMTFGLGSGVAGVAGVALSQLTNVGPNLGQSYIIDSFMVVVFGGVGNLLGTLVGAFSLGVTNKFLEPVTGAVLANILVLVFIILFIQKRPKGLFPQKGRAAE